MKWDQEESSHSNYEILNYLESFEPMKLLNVMQGRLWKSRELSPRFCVLKQTLCSDPDCTICNYAEEKLSSYSSAKYSSLLSEFVRSFALVSCKCEKD